MNEVKQVIIGNTADNKTVSICLNKANRHGFVAGATGTGKTVTLQTLAQGFSNAGVPVFAADIKGDLSGIAQAKSDDIKPPPVIFWDLFSESGTPIRTTVSNMGPILLSRLLDLNDTQTGVINILFRIAQDKGQEIITLKDLQVALSEIVEDAKQTTYGNVANATVGAVQRRLLVIENQGGSQLFGKPTLDLNDLMLKSPSGEGYVNILVADQLIKAPQLYATFLFWLMSELFNQLPEVGDLDKPKLVFFFDEAHLLFNDAPKFLLVMIEQIVRLIRSKGVGIYFITQNPSDIPNLVLNQLSNRVQHGLRAYTPQEQRGLKATAESFRVNPAFNTYELIQSLKVGEAIVSVLDNEGIPAMVQKVKVNLPNSHIGTIEPELRAKLMADSPLRGRYEGVQQAITARPWQGPKAAPEGQQEKTWTDKARPVVRPLVALASLIFDSTFRQLFFAALFSKRP